MCWRCRCLHEHMMDTRLTPMHQTFRQQPQPPNTCCPSLQHLTRVERTLFSLPASSAPCTPAWCAGLVSLHTSGTDPTQADSIVDEASSLLWGASTLGAMMPRFSPSALQHGKVWGATIGMYLPQAGSSHRLGGEAGEDLPHGAPQILLDERLGHEGGEARQPVLQPCQRLQAKYFFRWNQHAQSPVGCPWGVCKTLFRITITPLLPSPSSSTPPGRQQVWPRWQG